MTTKSAVIGVVRDVRRAIAPAEGPASGRAAVTGRSAKVTLLPGRFRGAEYVKRHVAFVIGLDDERGEQHVQRNLDAIRRRLDEMGVDREAIDAEVRSIEGAVRAELWRQILLP